MEGRQLDRPDRPEARVAERRIDRRGDDRRTQRPDRLDGADAAAQGSASPERDEDRSGLVGAGHGRVRPVQEPWLRSTHGDLERHPGQVEELRAQPGSDVGRGCRARPGSIELGRANSSHRTTSEPARGPPRQFESWVAALLLDRAQPPVLRGRPALVEPFDRLET